MDSNSRLQSARKEQQQQNSSTLHKIDILFYDAINELKQKSLLLVLYHFIKALLFIVLIPIDYTKIKKPNDPKILAAMILALVTSLLETLVPIIIFFRLRNNYFLIEVAIEMQHVTTEPLTGSPTNLKNCVSQTMYNIQNETLLSSESLTHKIKKMYTNFLLASIEQRILSKKTSIKTLNSFISFSGLASFIYAIVALAIGQYNSPQLALLIIYIILEGFWKIVFIIGVLFIALIPIICMIGCILLCCCYPNLNQEIKLPEEQKATEEMIVEAGGTCTICFQNFIVGNNVIRLNCSVKHMFHPLCISGWTKLKPTCPICRANVSNKIQLKQNA